MQPTDAAMLHKWENDTSHWKMSGTEKPFTKKEIKKFISSRHDIYLEGQLRWMIELSPSAKEAERNSIGCIDLFDFSERERKSGIGILIDKNFRANGYASEAVSLLATYCFEILNLKKLCCTISKDNIASIKLFRKNKFKITNRKNHELFLELMNH